MLFCFTRYHSRSVLCFKKKMELLGRTETSSWLVLLLMKLWNYIFLGVHFFITTLRMLDSPECNGSLSGKKALNEKPVLNMEVDKPSEEEMCMEEVQVTVTDRLGIGSREDEEEIWKNFSVNEFETMFDEEPPSLVEIEEVFQVFDENKDGYIDAAELQRILSGLFIKEEGEYELEECRRMLCAFDANGDGLIDFTEFVTFMEKLQ